MQIFVKPASGVKVRLPDTKKHIPEAGCMVEETSYILRRIAEGSLTVEQKPVQPVAKKPVKEDDK